MIQTKLFKRFLSCTMAAIIFVTPALVQDSAAAVYDGEVVFYEDFETPSVPDGTAIAVIEVDQSGNETIREEFNGWRVIDGRGGSNTTLQRARFTVETEPDKENRVGSLVRPADVDIVSNMGGFYMGKYFDKPATGIVEISFRVNPTNSAARYMPVILMSSSGSIVGNTQLDFANSRLTFASPVVGYFDGKISNGPATRNKWYDITYRFDIPNQVFYFYEGGNYIGKAENIGSIQNIAEIRFATHRNDTAQKGCQIFIDDIIVTQIGGMAVYESEPQNGENNADVHGGAVVEFTNRIDEYSLSDASVLINGSDENVGSISVNPENIKECIITYAEALDHDTNYNIEISGIKDVYGQTMSPASIRFKTRQRQLVFFDPVFMSGGSDITHGGISYGRISASVNVTNEMLDPGNAVFIAALFEGDDMKEIQAQEGSFDSEAQDSLSAELDVASPESSHIGIFVWDDLASRKPLSKNWNFDINGLTEGGFSYTTGADSLRVNTDHENGRVYISGNAPQGAAVTAVVLRPGFSAAQLSVRNISEAAEFVGQTIAGDGGFEFEFYVSPDDRENRKLYTVNVYGKTAGFKLFDSTDTANVISALNAASKEKIGEMLKKNNPVPIVDGIILNDVLLLDLSVYHSLNEPSIVDSEISKITFTSIEEIRQELPRIISAQAAEEARVQALIDEINAATWGNLEKIFKDNNAELQLDFTGAYATLSEAQRVSLYKKLANDYTFKTINEIRNAFSKLIQDVKNESPKGNTGNNGGGSPGGAPKVITESAQKPVTPTPTTNPAPEAEAFKDIQDVPWAVESIEALRKLKIIDGMGDGIFAPHEKVTREQFVKMLLQAFNIQGEAAASSFADVGNDAWYYPYVSAAAEKGIVSGIGDGLFGVGREISRAEMATLAGRALKITGAKLPAKFEPEVFLDANDIPEYAMEHIQTMQRAGIITGIGDNIFAPGQSATRAQAAKVVYGLISLAEK